MVPSQDVPPNRPYQGDGDVNAAPMNKQRPASLGLLPNLGPGIVANLAKIDVHSVDDLARIGAPRAHQRLRDLFPEKTWPVCYYLYSLDAALAGIPWTELAAERKSELLDQAGLKRRVKGATKRPRAFAGASAQGHRP